MQDKNKLLAGKQHELVCQRYPFLFWSSLLASGGLVATLWQVVERQSLLVGLFAVLWAAMALHFFYSRSYLASQKKRVVGEFQWRAALVVWAAVVGACWGFSVFAVASSPLEMSVILVMFVLAGVAAFASVTLAAVPFAAEAFLLPAILPGTLWMLFYGEKLVFFMGAITLAYLGLMLLFSQRTHQMIRSLFLTAEKNSQLLAAQRESDRRNAELFANFEDCIIFTDVGRDGSLTVASINPAMERLCGTSDEQVRGKRKLDLFPAALGERLEAYDRECIASGTPLHCEEMVEHASGKRYFSISKIPLRDETGRVSRIAVIARDITSRKQTEVALAKREREFRTLVENAPDPILRYDRDCRRVYVNKTVEWLGGIPASDMIGKTPAEAEWVGSGEKARVLQSIRRVLETGRQEEITLQIAAPDGSTLHLQHLHVPEFAADGSVESVLSIGRDITSRKYMEEVLRKSEREYRALSENSPDCIVRYDSDCRIRYLNNNFNAELGMPAGYLIGKTLSEIFTDGKFDEYEEALKQVIETGRSADHLITLQNPGDGKRYLHFRFVPELDKNGEMSGVLAIGRDISGLKRTEEELELKEFALDQAHEAAYLMDEKGLHFLYVNEAACRALGYSRDELLVLSLQDIDPYFTHEEGLAVEAAIQDGSSFTVESRHRRRDGSSFPVEIQSSMFEYQGRMLTLSLVRDITERKRMEAELQRTAGFQKLLLDSLREVGMWQLVVDGGKIIYHNDSHIGGLLGYATGDFDAVPYFIDVIHPDDRPRIVEMYRRRLVGEAVPDSYEIGLLAKDGSRREYQLYVSLIPDSNPPQTMTLAVDITERKHMEQALRRSEEEFRTLAENLPVAVIRYDTECRRRYLNHAAEKMLHGSAAELLGNIPGGPTVPATPGMIDYYRGRMEEVLDEGAPRELGFVLDALPPEQQEHYEVRFVPEYCSKGKICGVLAIWYDFTERKRMEDALKESKARYRDNSNLLQSVLESASNVSVFALDRNYRYLSFNANHRNNTKRLRGVDIAVGMSMLDTLDREEFREFCRQGFDHVLAGNSLTVESREDLMQDGLPISEYYENYGSPIRSDAGEVVGLTVFTYNITARKHAEEELRDKFEHIVVLNGRLEENARSLEEHATELEASQEQIKQTEVWYRSILHSAPDGMLVVDERGIIMLVNQRLEAMFGYARGELQGRSIEILLPHALRQQHEGMRAAYMDGDDAYPKAMNTRTVFGCHKDGSEFPVDVSLARLPEVEGMRRAVCASVRDISQRHAMETARDAALAEAQRLAQLRSAFMAQMSHELRTPLNGILGYTQNLLQGESLGEKQVAGLQIIRHSGEHLLSLINGILDHAAIEADKFELIHGDIELDAFLSSIIGMIRVRAEQKNLAFICEAAVGLPAVVRGDAQRLRQALLNLLANAVKFTDRGQVILRINCTASARLCFAVQDSGIGIAADQLETIFQPFEQVAESNRRAGGNGLGLAISRKLVRLMGGDIKVQSQPGAGSTFTFEIDMAGVQSETAQVDAAALSGLAVTRVAEVTPLLLLPSRQELDILYGHAVRGSMRDVIKHAERLADSDGRYLPFAEQLRLLAGSFQTKALVELIAEYRETRE